MTACEPAMMRPRMVIVPLGMATRLQEAILAACRREQAMAHYKALRLVRSRPFA